MACSLLFRTAMDFRIIKKMIGAKAVVEIHGRLAGFAVPELEKACCVAGRPLVLDLSNLHSADSTGIKLIRKLSTRGTELMGASPYFQMLLEGMAGVTGTQSRD